MKKNIVIIIGCFLLTGLAIFYFSMKTHYVVTIGDIRIEVDYSVEKNPKVVIKNHENSTIEVVYDNHTVDTFLLSNSDTNNHLDINFKEYSVTGISNLFINRTNNNAEKTDVSIMYDEIGISEIYMEDETQRYKEKKVFGGYPFYQGNPYFINAESPTPPPYVQTDFHPDAVLHFEQKNDQELWYITDYYEKPSVYVHNWENSSW